MEDGTDAYYLPPDNNHRSSSSMVTYNGKTVNMPGPALPSRSSYGSVRGVRIPSTEQCCIHYNSVRSVAKSLHWRNKSDPNSRPCNIVVCRFVCQCITERRKYNSKEFENSGSTKYKLNIHAFVT